MKPMIDRLDESGGNVFDRGFWRHPQSGAPIIRLPNGEGTFWGGAPSGRYKSHLENTYNLQRWAERQTVIGTFELVRSGDLESLPADLEGRDAKRVLDGLVGEAKEVAGATLAAARGTHGHLLSELNDEGASWLVHLESGEDLGLGHELQAAVVQAWRDLIEEYDLEILAVELTVVSAETQTAGTLDRIARTRKDLWFQGANGRNVKVPKGTVLVLDVKTGKIRIGKNRQPEYWSGYCLQVYCYATGRPILIDPEDPKNTQWIDYEHEAPSLKHALIAHIDIARAIETGVVEARMIYVDLTHAVKMEKAVRTVREIRALEPFGKVDINAPVTVRVPTEVPYLDVVGWLQRRMEAVRFHPEAKSDLLRHWPKEVTPPGKGIAPSDIDKIVQLLDRIEAKHQFTFGELDPRAPGSGHASHMLDRNPVGNPADTNPEGEMP